MDQLLSAGQEEKQLAIVNNSFDEEVPAIKVMADGTMVGVNKPISILTMQNQVLLLSLE